MLKLVFDIRVGFPDFYIAARDLFIDISFLADPEFYDQIELTTAKLGKKTKKSKKVKVPTEEAIYNEFKDNPALLVAMYKLDVPMNELAAKDSDFTAVYSKLAKINVSVPPLFEVSNYTLLYTNEDFKDKPKHKYSAADEKLLEEFFNALSDEYVEDTDDSSEGDA